MGAEPLNLLDAAAMVKMRDLSLEDSSDILDGMTAKELGSLARHLIELVNIARTYRGNPDTEPPLPIGEWCDAVMARQKFLQAPPVAQEPLDRPRRRRLRTSTRVHLREAFGAGPYGSSDPFGAGLESDDDDD